MLVQRLKAASSKPSGIAKPAKAPKSASKAKVGRVMAPAKEKKDCFVLLSGQGDDDCVDYQPVIGVFSKWPPLVKKAQAITKQKGVARAARVRPHALMCNELREAKQSQRNERSYSIAARNTRYSLFIDSVRK